MLRRMMKITVLTVFIIAATSLVAQDVIKNAIPNKSSNPKISDPANISKMKKSKTDIIVTPDVKTSDPDAVKSFDFNNVDVLTFVKQISKLTGKRFIVNESIASKKGITVIAPNPISVQESYNVFLSVLDANDLAVVKSDKFLRVVPKKDVSSGVTIYKGDYFPKNDEYITRLVKLTNINAADLANDLTDRRSGGSFVPATVRIKALEDTNTLLVTGTGSQIADIEEIVKMLDVAGENSQLVVIPIKNADASKIKDIIDNIIFQGAPNARISASASSRKDITRGAERYSKIFTDERTNSVIVLANKAGVKRIRALISKLDFEVQGDSDIHVYPLKNARAEDISTTLSAIIGAKSGAGKDSPFDGVKITADKWTNAIVVNAKPRQYDGIKAVIDGLDKRKGQVLFETITMEITLSDNSSFGVSSNYALSSEVPRAIGFDSGVSSTNNIMNFLANPSALSGMILGFGSNKTVSVTLNGTTLKIPTLSAFITAIEKNSEANVLQRPSIITSDNEEAEIKVMDKIPVVSGTVVSTGVSQQNITNVDVGLKLKITPRINLASDFIKLDVEQETSNLTDKAPKDLAGTTVSTNSRNIKTSVVVRDKDTVVLGGLYRDDVNVTYNKVPLLGDIPIIGWLFKGKTTSATKTNLLVFITPNIVRDYETHSNLTKKALQSRQGFIKEQMGGVDRFSKFTDAIDKKVTVQAKDEDTAKGYDMPETGVKPLEL